ncbi:MAG TPA: D-alanyl-D-alanine carboxypeptidase/D-alanyl-D-alanine-endopeptidase [Thermoanaerobaculia bacterium]|nr:D-alanyl-D-alanine carboxypeptidase/D-alanyl-D-alanine-endopeptidase [Thermoanaerobaculia bacterium]
MHGSTDKAARNVADNRQPTTDNACEARRQGPQNLRAKRAVIALLLLLLVPMSDAATHHRRRSSRKAAPAKPADVATGNTLSERVTSLMNGTVAGSSDVSLQVVDVDTGTVVAERNANTPLTPASNMKLFTTATAIDLLHPDFQVTTTVFMRGAADPGGTLTGDVKVVGHGDPTISGRFHDGHSTAVIDEWATDLKRAGVKTIKGNLIFEYGYMDTEYIHPSWPVNQLVNWYEAPVSAFSLQENCVQVRVSPTRPKKACLVQFEPPTSYLQLDTSCVTGRGVPLITRQRNTNTIIVRGGIPTRAGITEVFVTIENPVQYFATVAHETFARNGITVQGQIIVTPHDDRPDWKPVSQHATPLNMVVYVINKKSQNHYAEELVKIIGAETKKEGTWAAGTGTVTTWLTGKIGVPSQEFHQADGSGMSRENHASANAFVHLLRYMWKSQYRNDFVSSLPYSGDPDAKFGHRLRVAPFARQVFAKTGYIAGVVALSGYARGASGRIYAFSFVFNNYHVGVYAVYQLQDSMLKEIITRG